ncbi:MAG: tetratricopeptide repeat protein [Acidobacteria bacterium]|nr:tetratricopeptide repeat protein [Acidobacteriota bacterium]
MSEIVPTKTSDISVQENSLLSELRDKSVKIRVSPTNYFVGLFLATFFTGLLVYLRFDAAAGVLFFGSWILIPFLIWTDRITFNGAKLTRTGFLPKFWAWINHSGNSLNLDEIEQVETQALRAVKRGGSVFYRYRTSVRGANLQFVLASGGEEYRQMVKKFFPSLSENVLDNRSIELRDYLSEPIQTNSRLKEEKIPSNEVLETSINEFQADDKRFRIIRTAAEISSKEIEKADRLRVLGNELRLSGNLLQALEAFRRALVIDPRSGWLLFEFARCLHSFAGAEKNPKLERKALATLRLAERQAAEDQELLSRLGESYFQYGDWKRARHAFQKAIDVAEESFRSVRGLAEIALREGKIAHVIHHFATANRLAETPALRRWTQSEAEYFSRLNSDDDYMEMEVSRVNLLDSLERGKRTSLKIALFGLPWIIIGLILGEDLVVNIGWAVSTVALLIWVGMIMSRNILSARIPVDVE